MTDDVRRPRTTVQTTTAYYRRRIEKYIRLLESEYPSYRDRIVVIFNSEQHVYVPSTQDFMVCSIHISHDTTLLVQKKRRPMERVQS